MTFDVTPADIQLEVANLEKLGITAYQTKHLVLCPLIERVKKINGVDIDQGQKFVEEATKDLNLFFPVVAVAQNIQKELNVSIGSGVFSSGAKRFITIPRDQMAPVMTTAVYALVEDYDVDLTCKPVAEVSDEE